MATPLDLPRGVMPETVLLKTHSVIAAPGGTSVGYDDINWRPGSGFVIGIEGIFATLNTMLTVDSGRARAGITLDPDQTTTAIATLRDDRSTITALSREHQFTTSGETDNSFSEWVWFPTPLFTVRDARAFVANASNDMGGVVQVYYRIYSVPEDQFIRIAGLSLAQGA